MGVFIYSGFSDLYFHNILLFVCIYLYCLYFSILWEFKKKTFLFLFYQFSILEISGINMKMKGGLIPLQHACFCASKNKMAEWEAEVITVSFLSPSTFKISLFWGPF